MALVHVSPIVRAAATKIVQMPSGIQLTPVNIYNGSANPLYIGDATCGTSGASTGLTIPAASSAVICLNANDSLYAAATSVTAAGAIVILYSGI
jgi:hypothetical protein